MRWRTVLIVVPLLAGLAFAGAVGARMMISDRTASERAVCWDESVAEDAANCPQPTGLAGLRHVFPSFDPDRLECSDDLAERAGGESNLRPTSWTCTRTVAGSTARVTYFELADAESGVRFQQRRFGSRAEAITDDAGTVVRRVWRGRVEGDFVLVALYPDPAAAPYAVEVAAERPAVRERAFRTVRMRASRELALRP